MQLYKNTDIATTWKTSSFDLTERLDFQIIDSQSIAVHAFLTCLLTSLSVDKILLPRYVNLFTNFKGSPFNVEMDTNPCCEYGLSPLG